MRQYVPSAKQKVIPRTPRRERCQNKKGILRKVTEKREIPWPGGLEIGKFPYLFITAESLSTFYQKPLIPTDFEAL